MLLTHIGERLTIYLGIFILIFGIIGNTINVIIFSSVQTYRKVPSFFYLFVGSITNILFILINLISRIVSNISEYDLTRSSSAWCKIRQYFLSTLCCISLSCSCLVTMDQFFSTSKKISLRYLSNIKYSYRFIFLILIIWCFHGIIPLVAFDISSTAKICTFISNRYNIYGLFYFLGLITTIPISIMITFSYLIHRNIHQIIILAERGVDRRLRQMILIEVMFHMGSIVLIF